MKISKRLTAVTGMAAPGSFVVDVGCDHGYTAITLVEEGICTGAVASDVREGPLRAASANVARAKLSGKIRIVLADGIPGHPEEYLPANVPALLVVTGMGGQLILRILREAGRDLSRFSELILGPQSEIPLVRRELPELGFAILDERMVEEDGKFYVLIRAVKKDELPEAPRIAGEGQVISEELSLAFGRPLLLRKDPALARYLLWQHGILEKIEENLLTRGREQTERMSEISENKRLIKEAMAFLDLSGR